MIREKINKNIFEPILMFYTVKNVIYFNSYNYNTYRYNYNNNNVLKVKLLYLERKSFIIYIFTK